METQNRSRELSISRILNAPIDLVWEVWSKPEHIAQWWGPIGFTNDIDRMDFKEGGEWVFTMIGPDGKHYANRSVFNEIVPGKKIVFEHFSPHFITTIEFEAQGEETLMNWTGVFDSAEILDNLIKTVNAKEGLSQNIDRLENYLEQLI